MSKYNSPVSLIPGNIDSILLTRIPEYSTVLEFGPAHGRMTRYLKEVKYCKVYCVEIDNEAARDSALYSEQMVVDNIENYQWSEVYADLQFDIIIFADVLEHLYDPWKVLKICNNFLKPCGSIFISIPNVAHGAIIMGLMQNEFDYKDTGLLDDTHIRFFTKKSLERLIDDTGYGIFYASANFVKPSCTEFKKSYLDFNAGVAQALTSNPFVNAYQFCYIIKKQEYLVSNSVIPVIDFEEKNKIALYVDTGDGFSENEVNYAYSIDNDEISIQQTKPIFKLRFDPSENSCKIKDLNFIVIGSDGCQYSCIIESSNASYIIDNEYIFFTSDPQFVLIVPILNPKVFVYSLNYQEINISNDEIIKFSVYSGIVNEIKSKNQELLLKEEELELKNQELSSKQEELELKNHALLLMQQQCMNTINSVSWKITKPIRGLKLFLYKFIRFVFLKKVS